ncbi:MAG: glycosyltransferase family 39 protein [Bacteroidota bacterium]
MLKKAIDLLTPNYGVLKDRTVLFIFFLTALFIRLPFFFRDYIDRDESTFIIMGQAWVDGYLPYLELWDLKPPVTFLYFACIIYAFGKSFIAIRFFGTMLVVGTAFFTYRIGNRITSRKIAFWAGFSCVLLQSMFGSLQGVMSEHICIFFFTMALYLFLSRDIWYWYLFSGMLMGFSLMSKLNMAYPIFLLGIFTLYHSYRKERFLFGMKKMAIVGFGILVVIFATAVPYYIQGETGVWRESIFKAPLAYSSSKGNSVLKVLPFALFIAFAIILMIWKKLIALKNKDMRLLLVLVAAIVLSFLQTGRVNGHYMIQLYPFLVIPLAIAISKIAVFKRINYASFVLLVSLVLPLETYQEYTNILHQKMESGSFFNGEGIEVPRYIIENSLETKNIFFTEYHIGYWVLGVHPPTKAVTHPSSIARDGLFPFMQNPRETSMEELRYILEEIKPEIIVARKNKRIFGKKFVELNEYIDAYLSTHYTLLKTVDKGLIYQRQE